MSRMKLQMIKEKNVKNKQDWMDEEPKLNEGDNIINWGDDVDVGDWGDDIDVGDWGDDVDVGDWGDVIDVGDWGDISGGVTGCCGAAG